MAEVASAIIAFASTEYKAWHFFEALITTIQNSPADIQHWRAVGNVLKKSCSLMEERLKEFEHDSFTAAEEEYLDSIRTHISSFSSDIKSLTHGLPDADSFNTGNPGLKQRTIAAFELRLNQDKYVIERVDRSINIFQISASGLNLLKSGSVDRVREVLNQLGETFPKLPSDDHELESWRTHTQLVLTDAATRDFPEDPDLPIIGPDDPEELQYEFEATQSLAAQFCNAGMHILAMPFQLQALDLGRQLPLNIANQVNLAEKYVDIAISCQKHDQTAVDSAVKRLELLGSIIRVESDLDASPRLCEEQHRIGSMFARLKDPTSAIIFLRNAIRDYVSLGVQDNHLQIWEIYKQVLNQYQVQSAHASASAFRKKIRDTLGPELFMKLSGIDRVIEWCTNQGFNVTQEEDLSFAQLTNERGNTPLHEAALDQKMDLSILEELMLLEDFYEVKDNNGDTPLLTAVSRSNIAVLTKLLELVPYLVHVRDKSRQTALHRCRDTEALKLVLSAIAQTEDSTGETPSGQGREKIDIDSKCSYEKTALHLFCERGQPEFVEILVRNGADVNAGSLGGKTPLMFALRQGFQDKDIDQIIRTLIINKAHTEGTDDYGRYDVGKALKKRGYTRSKILEMTEYNPKAISNQKGVPAPGKTSSISSWFNWRAWMVGHNTLAVPTAPDYASMRLDAEPPTKGKTVSMQLASEPVSNQMPPDYTEEEACNMYPAGSKLPENEMNIWKTEISEAIFDHICLLTSDRKLDIVDRFNKASQCLSDQQESAPLSTLRDEPRTGKDVGKWETKTGKEVPDQERLQNAKSLWNDTMEDIDSTEEIGEQQSVPESRRYHDIIFKSVSYKWLMAELTKTILLAVVEGDDDVCVDMHTSISAYLVQNKSASCRRLPERYTMRFSVEWNPIDFLCEQFSDDSDIENLLGDTLTLTGSFIDAQALPCAEYLRQTWPMTGPDLLDLLKKALVSGQNVVGELGDKSTVECLFKDSSLDVQVEGTTDSIAMVGEQIAWLGAALHPSCSESGLATSHPQLKISTPSAGPAICTIQFLVEVNLEKGQKSVAGQCWHALFQNPVIVSGYPIPRRTQYSSGLEIPLNVMSGLTQCPRINKYLGRHFLKGFSTALFPTKKLDDAILWHLDFSTDGSRLAYPNLDEMDNLDMDIGELAAGRHIVGWCSEAKFFAGAPGMNYAIGTSRLERPGREFALEKISFSAGQIVTGGCQFAIGRKDTPIRITHGSYRAKLQWIIRKYVTLWDVDEQRGWLINGCAALVHLLRMSLESSKLSQLGSEFHFQDDKFEESSNPLGLSSALEILLNPNNQKLELDIKEQKSFTETRVLQDSQEETVRKTVTTWTTLRDRVEELYETLEKLIDHNVTSEASYKGINAKLRLQDQLEGWDFTDVATDQGPFYLRKANLPIHLLSWVDFVRQIPAITLFGKGFGDIIRASPAKSGDKAVTCQEWERLPKNKYLLGVSVSDLQDIINRIGEQGADSIMVAPGMMWKNPIKGSPFHENCLCLGKGQTRQKHNHHSIQELVPDMLRPGTCMVDLDKHQNGAVIFGSRPEWKLPWRFLSDVGSAEKESPTESVLLGDSGTSEMSSGNGCSSSSQAPTSLGSGDPDHSSLRTSANSRLGTSGQRLTPEETDSGTEHDTLRPPVPQDSEREGVVSPNEFNQDEEMESQRSERQSWVRRKAFLIKKTFIGG
ncbi:pfs domain [Fusarium albosuccineum]|uniref:Pfs domain n=1 Tax=Fusarium albosuccineum TaxID=1237068 RepID=A0A8H4PGC4_9HYPO|nr:pfs domain [Fusarium albosuccineum]